MVRPNDVPFQRIYNFINAQWSLFSKYLDSNIDNLYPLPKHNESFVEKVKRKSRKHILREWRTNMDNYNSYINMFENNLFKEQIRKKRKSSRMQLHEKKTNDRNS